MEKITFDFELFKQIVGALVENNVTDIHISPGAPPYIRQARQFTELRLPVTDEETGKNMLVPIEPMLPNDTKKFVEDLVAFSYNDESYAEDILRKITSSEEVETTLSLRGVSRFRVHFSLQRSSVSCTIQVVPDKIPDIAVFPNEIRNFIKYNNGLVIVSGKTGSGKTTTLASLIEEMNRTKSRKIITLEDPIEYLHKHNHCMITQREIGSDTKNYKTGLLSALREDPDVIVVGELRDVETFEIALNAAESGCLIITTMHSSNTKETLERIISMFSADKQNQIKGQLATVLKGIICQQLINCIDPNYGTPLVPAFEIMTSNPQLAEAIRKGNFKEVPKIMEENKLNNMRIMRDSLQKLREKGLISDDDWFTRNSLLTTISD